MKIMSEDNDTDDYYNKAEEKRPEMKHESEG